VLLLKDELIPLDASLVNKVENHVHPYINGDSPVIIYEYYSEQTKNSKAYIKNEEKGYITTFIGDEGSKRRLVVGLGREEFIQ
jgi:hypothetical protein